jgi:hypothetical protein
MSNHNMKNVIFVFTILILGFAGTVNPQENSGC